MTMKISSKLTGLIRRSKSFLIAGHINPEGDSIGSSLALALGLKKLGKEVHVISSDPVPENLRFLPSSKIIKQKPPIKKLDLLVLVDCNIPARTGFRDFNVRQAAVIDHHVLPADEVASEFHRSLAAGHIDSDAAAAGVLVYKFLNKLKIDIDKKIATNLYTAILVDTGGFRYSNASPESLRIAASLVKAGARPADISNELFDSVPFRSMKLLGLMLSTLDKKDGIAWTTATKTMFYKTGTTAEDCEDFVDFPRKVKDAEVAVFFRQEGNKSFKLSLRSKGRVNVQKVAMSFGGGGHVAAAGCKVKGSLKEVQDKVFRAIRNEIRN
jgi:phosphoesterase RecJ-like protein